MKKIFNLLLSILLLVTVALAVYMVVAGGSRASASLNIVWTYVLIGIAIVSALACAVWGMLQKPTGIKGALLSVALVAVIVVAAYLIANGHDFQIPNLADGGFFPRPETVLSDASLLVTYVALGGTVLVAIFSEVYKAFK